MEVIEASEKDPKLSKVNWAQKFDLSESKLRGILKNKDEIKKMSSEYSAQAKKWPRIQNGKYHILETTLIKWFREMRASNLPHQQRVIQRKSTRSVIKNGNWRFLASWGWLDKVKKRHGLTNHCLSGESAAVDDSSVN